MANAGKKVKPARRTAKIDARALQCAKTVAARRGVALGAYLDSVVVPAVSRDYFRIFPAEKNNTL